MDRYKDLRSVLLANKYQLTPTQGMDLLRKVSQGPEVQRSTGFIQWSGIYNLTQKSVTMSVLREWGQWFTFEVEYPPAFPSRFN